MDPLTVIGLLSTLASIGSNIAKSQQQRKHAQAVEEYQDEMLEQQEEDIAERNRQRKRAALGRAIGSDIQIMPQEERVPLRAPEEPDLYRYDIAGGVSRGIGALAGSMGDQGSRREAIGRRTKTVTPPVKSDVSTVYEPFQYGVAYG